MDLWLKSYRNVTFLWCPLGTYFKIKRIIFIKKIFWTFILNIYAQEDPSGISPGPKNWQDRFKSITEVTSRTFYFYHKPIQACFFCERKVLDQNGPYISTFQRNLRNVCLSVFLSVIVVVVVVVCVLAPSYTSLCSDLIFYQNIGILSYSWSYTSQIFDFRDRFSRQFGNTALCRIYEDGWTMSWILKLNMQLFCR